MPLQLDIFGYTYDDSEPAFIDAGPFWFHRPTKRLLTKTSVAAYMASFTPAKTMGAKESGTLSAAYITTHMGIPAAPAAPAPAAGAPIVTAISGAGSATAKITVTGGPADKAYTITPAVNAGAVIAGLTPVAVAKGDILTQVAAKLVTALNGKKDAGNAKTLKAVAAVGVVTVTETGGANIATITAAVS